MSINLKLCDKTCHDCIKGYILKHSLERGDSFDTPCNGIPLEYVPDNVVAALGGDKDTATAIFDPVTWAAHNLDWYCIDPTGEHWKRKTDNGTIPTGLPNHDPVRGLNGQSIFHRPYQAEMLRCTSKRKVFRLGRQSGKTEALCIAILHAIFTNEDFKVVVIAPYQSQIDLIFTRLANLISSNSMLSNSIKRSVKAPNYQIMLHNKSKVTGFTAGTRSGQDAGASRGQSANMLVFDEADYLSAGDIDAALAIITNFPDATVWMSSTPTGRRERFYQTCFSKLFKEFHFPSQINPNWTEALDALYQEQLTEDGYKHEILAEFGEQEEGVYQAKYVEAAQSNYEYSDMVPKSGWIYMLGCDWNDPKIGTTIAIVGFDPNTQIFYLCDKHVVSRGNRTQLSACEKIAELNRVWQPSHIYVDQGYETTQIEILHEFGHRSIKEFGPNHPNSRLHKIVKGYSFGSTIDTHDLITQQPIKKHAKPFLIENSVRRFESGTFKYPKSDENYTDQLLGYIIDRVTDTGRFVYKQQNESAGDHFLDAVNLALVGFTLEKTKFGKPIFDTSVAFAGKLRGDSSFEKGRQSFDQQAKEHRPKEGRSELARAKSVVEELELPASNLSQATGVRLWRWPEFGHDGPKPVARSRGEAFRQAEQRILGKRKSNRRRPKRTKF